MGAGHGGGGAANAVDDIQEEDEAVRCVCGFDDYPGPPPVNSTDADDPNTAFLLAVAAADVNEDLAGFFVQCDVCKVWQHGACVGMMPDQTGPDEYFCEQCRKDLHKIYKAKNG